MNTLDATLEFEDNHLLMQTTQQYGHNNKIKSSASNKWQVLGLITHSYDLVQHSKLIRLKETPYLKGWVQILLCYKQVVYTKQSFVDYPLPLFFDMMLDGKTECFREMSILDFE